MKMGKNVALMALGAGALMAYQKYNKPIKKKAEKVASKAAKKADRKLENMI